MNLNILADENIPAVEHYFGELGTVRYCHGRTLASADVAGVDVLLVRSITRVDASLLRDSPVTFVGTATSGVEHIDRNYLVNRRIGFAHAPGSNANSVVEYVLAAIAAVGETLEQLLSGGTVGIVGYGVIGKALASRLDNLGIRHCVYDPWLDQAVTPCAGTLEDVLNCSVLTLHPELTQTPPFPSLHLIGSAQLTAMNAHSLLINASRGQVVDNAALLEHLSAATGPSIVLDVWEGEPQISGALLERVAMGTAHIAGYSLDGKLRATEQLRNALAQQLGEAEHTAASPAPTDAGISLPGNVTGAALVRFLLQSRYDITADDALLRAAIFQSASSGAKNFDLLRKNYGQRRELYGARVLGELSSPADRALVQALGCTLEDTVATL